MQRAQPLRLLLGLMATFPSACSDPADGPAPPALVTPEAWTLVDAEEDPFKDRPNDATCPSASMEVITLPDESAAAGGIPGEDVFQIHTGDCNYLTVKQASLGAVSAGQTIRLRLWHFALLSPEPAEAHAAIQIGDTVAWEQRLRIPQPAGLVEVEWKATEDLPGGSPIFFHLHNHGTNTWALWKLDTL